MAKIPFKVAILFHRRNRLILTEALLYPELSWIGTSRKKLKPHVIKNLEKFTAGLDVGTLYSRRCITQPRLQTIELELTNPYLNQENVSSLQPNPPKENLCPVSHWLTPLKLSLTVVVWDFDKERTIVFVPLLNLYEMLHSSDDFEEVVKKLCHEAIIRENLYWSLQRLGIIFNNTQTRLDLIEVEWEIPTEKKRSRKQIQIFPTDNPFNLKSIATELISTTLSKAYHVESYVQQIAEILGGENPQSILLVGPSGVGKSAIARELVRTADNYQLGSTPFYQTSGARLVAGQIGYGMWQERVRKMIAHAQRHHAIFLLGNLVELMEVGKGRNQPTSIAQFLSSAIATGEFRCIVECTPEQIPLIEKVAPHLLDAFQKIEIPEPDEAMTLAILRDVAKDTSKVVVPPEVLQTIVSLHRRYATDSAFPNRPVRFLNQLLDQNQNKFLTVDEVRQAFSRETGLPLLLIDPQSPLDLSQVRNWFEQRVIGQPEAISQILSVLTTAKAGLSRLGQPIASLLFVGPTGVGKTEAAKAFTEFFFGSPDRLTRFDMSEYADPLSVRRLIGTSIGQEGLLTTKVREQPFSVLLFDEFEKADPSVFDLFLQILGEARLSDAAGRLADFRNCLIILTSNLGAESFLAGNFGLFTSSREFRESKAHFTRVIEKFLRLEIVNRIDRIIPFVPLDRPTIQKIALKEWEKILTREGTRQRGLQVHIEPEILDTLCQKDFDPRYGARPLKRAMERQLLVPLAKWLNTHPQKQNESLIIQRNHSSEISIKIQQTQPTSESSPSKPLAQSKERSLKQILREVDQLRYRINKLSNSSTILDLTNEVNQLNIDVKDSFRLNNLLANRPVTVPSIDQIRRAKIGRLKEILDAHLRLQKQCADLDEKVSLAYYMKDDSPIEEWQSQVQKLNQDWFDLLYRLYELKQTKSLAVSLAIFSDDPDWLEELARAYFETAQGLGMPVSGYRYLLVSSQGGKTSEEEEPAPHQLRWIPSERRDKGDLEYLFSTKNSSLQILAIRQKLTDFEEPFVVPDCFGICLGIQDKMAYLRFSQEEGIHLWQDSKNKLKSKALILASNGNPEDFLPPTHFQLASKLSDSASTRRVYRADRQLIHDTFTNEQYPWKQPLSTNIELLTNQVQQTTLDRIALE